MSDEKPMTIRAACRARRPLGGPDAQALEGALQQVERELATARTRIAELEGETLARWNAINESLAENRDLSRRLQLAVGALDSLVGQLEEARLYEIPGGQKVSRTPAWCGLGPGKRQLLERFIADMRAALSPPPAEPPQSAATSSPQGEETGAVCRLCRGKKWINEPCGDDFTAVHSVPCPDCGTPNKDAP